MDYVQVNEVKFEAAIYPRSKWNTSTVERYADALIAGDEFECLWAITKCGTIRRAAKWLNCSPVWLRKQLPDSDFVYFIQSLDKIKIGLSHGKRFAGRVGALHVANPHGLVLVCALRGGKELESRLHRQFARWHVTGEWFDAHPVLLHLDGNPYEFGDSTCD